MILNMNANFIFLADQQTHSSAPHRTSNGVNIKINNMLRTNQINYVQK